MKLEEQCTTFEQSKRLLELGIDEYTASIWWRHDEKNNLKNGVIVTCVEIYSENCVFTPCWTIADMMKIIYSDREFSINILSQVEIYSVDEPSKYVIGKEVTIRDDYSMLRDNLFEALVWLKENKYL